MAIRNTTPTRRAVLAAALSLPLIGTGAAAMAAAGGVPFVDRSAWDAAMLDVTAAADAMNAYDRDHLIPAGDTYMAVRDKWPLHYNFEADPVAKAQMRPAFDSHAVFERRFEEFVTAHHDACETLLLTPAPTPAELAVKLELLVQHEVYEWTVAPPIMEAIRADARHLLGGEA